MGVQARDILMAMFQLSKEIRLDSRQSPTHEDNMDVATKPVTSDFFVAHKTNTWEDSPWTEFDEREIKGSSIGSHAN